MSHSMAHHECYAESAKSPTLDSPELGGLSLHFIHVPPTAWEGDDSRLVIQAVTGFVPYT